MRAQSPHEIDSVITALASHLYVQSQAGSIGIEEEGKTIILKKQDWRILKT